MVQRILGTSRFLILFAVLGSFVAAATTLIYSGVVLLRTVVNLLTFGYADEKGPKQLSVAMIELIDLYLLGVVLYLVAQGLYELFIDPNVPVPRWMKIGDLDQLKARIVSVIIVLLGVTFLGKAVTWETGWEILAFGGAIAAVIAALYLALRLVLEESREEHG